MDDIAQNGNFNFLKNAKISGRQSGRNSLFTVSVKDQTNSVINSVTSVVVVEHMDFSLTSLCSFPSLFKVVSSSFLTVNQASFGPPEDVKDQLSPMDATLFGVSDSHFTLNSST